MSPTGLGQLPACPAVCAGLASRPLMVPGHPACVPGLQFKQRFADAHRLGLNLLPPSASPDAPPQDNWMPFGTV